MSTIIITKPNYLDAPTYYHYYFDLVVQNNLMEALDSTKNDFLIFIKKITVEKESYAYASDKWTVKEVIRHIIDTERILQYRAFRFSRFDATDLQGFDEDLYVSNVKKIEFSLEDLLTEYLAVRNSTYQLFKNIDPEMLDFQGTANQLNTSARAIAYLIVGHQVHHLKVLEEKYF